MANPNPVLPPMRQHSRRQCITCQRGFTPKPGRGRPAIYCGPKCRDWWRAFDKRAAYAVRVWREIPPCEVCGEPVMRRGDAVGSASQNKRYCSRSCRAYDIGDLAVTATRCRIHVHECEDCGVLYTSHGPGKRLVCAGCRPLRAAAKAAREAERARRKNRARRLAKRNAGPAGIYTLAEVVDRDGQMCGICGLWVDVELSGRDPQGPTVDHVVPLSRGGADVIENVRLAHWICNVRRGAPEVLSWEQGALDLNQSNANAA